jgi:hypothetical protein
VAKGRSDAGARVAQLHRTLSRLDIVQGSLAALAAGSLYATGACRTIFTGDSAELATAAAVLGIPHPPGYPLYTLLTAIVVRLAPVGNPAFAANLATAGYGALAVGLLLLLLLRLGMSSPAAWAGTLTLALGRTFWGQCLAAEVYTLDILLLLVVLHAAIPRRRGSGGAELLAGLAIGLWLTHRIVNVLYLPTFALAAWACGWRIRGRGVVTLAVGVALGLVPLLYLPIASAADPYLDMGDPQTWSGFAWLVNPAKAYRHHLDSGTAALALGRTGRFFRDLPAEIGVAALLAALGACVALRRDRLLAAAFLWLIVANVAFTARYNVPDVQSYYLPGYVAWCALAAWGADSILPRGRVPRRLAAALLLAAAALGLPIHLAANDLSGQRIMHAMASDLLAAVEPNAVVMVRGDNTETGPVYLQAVEGRARGVIVLDPLQWDDHDWYRRSLAHRHPDVEALRAAADDPDPPRAGELVRDLARSRPIYSTYSPEVTEHLPELRLWPAGLVEALGSPDRPPDPSRVALGAQRLIDAVAALQRPGPEADANVKVIYAGYAFALLNTGGALLVYYRDPAAAARAFEAVVSMDPDPIVRDVYASRDAVGQVHTEAFPGRQAKETLDRLRP